jgi:hypothetical protein
MEILAWIRIRKKRKRICNNGENPYHSPSHNKPYFTHSFCLFFCPFCNYFALFTLIFNFLLIILFLPFPFIFFHLKKLPSPFNPPPPNLHRLIWEAAMCNYSTCISYRTPQSSINNCTSANTKVKNMYEVCLLNTWKT